MINTIEQHQVTSKILFELEHAKEWLISDELLHFLESTEYPWELLGTPLVKFVEQCIQNIPEGERIKGSIHPTAFIEHPEKLFLGEGAVIEPYAYISGSAYIEPHAVVRHGAYIRGSVFASSYSIIGHSTECKGSILLPHAKAAHLNYVGDSILGHDCNLGAGTKLANLKLKHDNIFLRFGKNKVDTKLRKFGSIIGNKASIGCNAVANPGTIFLPNTVLHPNATGLGVITAKR